MVKRLFPILAPNLNIIVFYQKRHQRVAVTATASLHTTNFIKKRRQDPLIGVAYTRKLVSIGVLDRATDQRLAVLERPFMNSMLGIMDIAVKNVRAQCNTISDRLRNRPPWARRDIKAFRFRSSRSWDRPCQNYSVKYTLLFMRCSLQKEAKKTIRRCIFNSILARHFNPTL